MYEQHVHLHIPIGERRRKWSDSHPSSIPQAGSIYQMHTNLAAVGFENGSIQKLCGNKQRALLWAASVFIYGCAFCNNFPKRVRAVLEYCSLICTHMCSYVRAYIRTYVHIHIYIYKHIYSFIYIYICIYIYIYIHTYIYIYIYIQIHAHIRIHIHIHIHGCVDFAPWNWHRQQPRWVYVAVEELFWNILKWDTRETATSKWTTWCLGSEVHASCSVSWAEARNRPPRCSEQSLARVDRTQWAGRSWCDTVWHTPSSRDTNPTSKTRGAQLWIQKNISHACMRVHMSVS